MPMKFLAFIFSIYILALNFAPCEDNSAFESNVNIEISQITDADHGHNALDLCSPFCQCHCCHIHATHFKMAEFTMASENIPTNIFLHFDSFGIDINNSILQPPRV